MTNHNVQSLGMQVPSDWKIQRLGDLGEVRGRVGWKGYTKKDLVQSGALAIGGRQMGSNCRLDLSEPVHLSQAKFIESPEIAIKRDDILIAQRGTLGKIALVDQEIGDATINPSLVIFRPRLICSVYATYFLASTAGQLQIEEATSKTGVPMISQKQIENMLIARPSCEREEALVAEVLNDIEHQLSALELELDKKSQVKQAAMQELLTGKRRLPGFEGEWVAGKLGDYVEKIVGGGTPSRANPGFWGGEIPWATVKDLTSFQPNQTQEWLTRDGLKNSSANLIPAGTLIASTRMALGKAVIFGTDVAINQDLKAIFFGKNGMARFFCYWFEANASAIDAIGGGSTVKGISLSQLKALDVASPGLAEQNAIVDVISDIETEIETLENRLTKTRAIKQAMMQELLTGRIRLR